MREFYLVRQIGYMYMQTQEGILKKYLTEIDGLGEWKHNSNRIADRFVFFRVIPKEMYTNSNNHVRIHVPTGIPFWPIYF